MERVVAEAQLRPGLLVEFLCRECTVRHRTILLCKSRDRRMCGRCRRSVCGYDIPASFHGLDSYLCTQFPGRQMWIVNPFEEDSQTTSKARERERAR